MTLLLALTQTAFRDPVGDLSAPLVGPPPLGEAFGGLVVSGRM